MVGMNWTTCGSAQFMLNARLFLNVKSESDDVADASGFVGPTSRPARRENGARRSSSKPIPGRMFPVPPFSQQARKGWRRKR